MIDNGVKFKCPFCGQVSEGDAQCVGTEDNCPSCGRRFRLDPMIDIQTSEPNCLTCYFGMLKQYAKFKGRTPRREFWWAFVFHLIASSAIAVFEFVVFYDNYDNRGLYLEGYLIATFVPFWSIQVRRLHDTSKSGWWVLLAPIPVLNLVYFAWLASVGDEGENLFGEDPKKRNPRNFKGNKNGYANHKTFSQRQSRDRELDPKLILCDECGAKFGLVELGKCKGHCPHCNAILPISRYCHHIPEKRFWPLYSNARLWAKIGMIICGAIAALSILGGFMDACEINGRYGFSLAACSLSFSSFYGGVWLTALISLVPMAVLLHFGRSDKEDCMAYKIAKGSGADLTSLQRHRQKCNVLAIVIFIAVTVGCAATFYVFKADWNRQMRFDREQVEEAIGAVAEAEKLITDALSEEEFVGFASEPADFLQGKKDIQKTRKMLIRMTKKLEKGIDACGTALFACGLKMRPGEDCDSVIQSLRLTKEYWFLWHRLVRHSRMTLAHFEERNSGASDYVLKQEWGLRYDDSVDAKLEEELFEYDKLVADIQAYNDEVGADHDSIKLRKVADQRKEIARVEAERKAKAEIERIAKEEAARKAEEERKTQEELTRLAAEIKADEEERERQQVELARQEEEKRLAREETRKAIELFKLGEWRTGLAQAENADKNDAELLFWTGICYELGIGDDCDVARAVKLYRTAAEKGNADALLEMGRRYESGEGVLPDADKARRSRKAATRQGVQTAGYDHLLRLRAQRQEELEAAAARKAQEEENSRRLQELREEVARLKEEANKTRGVAHQDAAKLLKVQAVPSSDKTREKFDGAPTLSLLKFTKKNVRAKSYYDKACALAEIGSVNKNKVKEAYDYGRSCGGPKWPELEAWLEWWK